MRFFPTGADIPLELIEAVNDGEVVFLCGAGVSRPDLPSFERLTDQVYKKLGASRDDEPAERIAFERKEFDRVLRSLEKRTRPPGAPSAVRDVVSQLLKAKPSADLSKHRSLLQLSRDSQGRVRLLTTNFDTLFERAARAANLDVESHATKSIPKPGGRLDFGILHLHGRITDRKLKLKETELILTSADFGDAYLRDGWASQYIEDRMRIGMLVLVGYAAEDAALRLLLEALDADRERFPDLKNVYALEKGTPDSASMWKSKGIVPLEFKDYPDIYATLQEWARYARDPTAYSRARTKAILNPS